MAEELGLMREIGEWVLKDACKQLQDWRARLPLDGVRLAVAVNLSAVELQGNDLPNKLRATLADSGLPADCLELEITENVLIREPEKTATMLNAVAALGVRLSLDDFGTGYSSFEHLQLFPIHSLKIDRSFVANIGKGQAPERLLAAMIRFGRELKLTVVAEGIETLTQAHFCQAHGCDLLQGFYYARPVSAEQFEAEFLAKLPVNPS
jgi:EAL domain-containing protein (putative c-di-GMP-specific phosphodiesterase class I)